MVTTMFPPHEKEEKSGRAARQIGWPINYASSVPAIVCGKGKEEEKISAGDVGVHRHLGGVSQAH